LINHIGITGGSVPKGNGRRHLGKGEGPFLNTKNAFVVPVPFFLHTGTRLFNFLLKLFLQVDDRFCYGPSLAETKEIDES